MNFLERFAAGFAFAAVAMALCFAILFATVLADAHLGLPAAAAVFFFGICTAVGALVAFD